MDQIINVELDRIEPDPDQPRKYFDEAKLQELAVSITEHWVRTPITLRPNPKKKDAYIIEVGERRWRASQIAGKTEIPAIIDTAKYEPGLVLELQLIENSQREDIGALEEGETYLKLKKHFGHTVETLMSRTGKSRSHVYSRIALTNLAEPVKKALRTGELEPAIADIIATIGDAKLQEQALKDCLGKSDHNAYRDGHVEVETADGAKLPLSFRAARMLINTKYKLRLQLAPFDIADEKLTKAGACGPCPFRSGNQPELPGVAPATKVEDMCQRPSCFQEKTKAAFDKAADEHKALGHRIVLFKEAEKLNVFSWNKTDIGYSSPWVDPKDAIPYDITGNYESKSTWKGMLGTNELAKVPRAFVQDASGRGRELLDRAAAVDALRKNGKLKHKKTSSPGDANYSKERAEEREKEKLRAAAYGALIDKATVAAAKDLPAAKEVAMWRWVALAIAGDYHYTERTLFSDRRGLDFDTQLETLVEKAKTAGELRALIVEMLMCKMADAVIEETGDSDEAMALAEKLFGLDWNEAELAAQAEAESLKESEAAAKAKEKLLEAVRTGKRCGAKTNAKPPEVCLKPYGHEGNHMGKTEVPWANDEPSPAGRMDGKDCGVIDGKKGNACIHDQGHDGPHSDGKRTWANKPAKKGGAK